MKNKLTAIIIFNLFLALILIQVPKAQEKNVISAGKIYMPISIKYGNDIIPKGKYDLKIIFEDSNPYIEISKGEKKLIKELAIVIKTNKVSPKPKVEVAKIYNQEFLRIRILYQNNWYYAYFEELK